MIFWLQCAKWAHEQFFSEWCIILLHIFYSLAFQMSGWINNVTEKTLSAELETRDHRGSKIIITEWNQAPGYSSYSWRAGGKEREEKKQTERERRTQTPFAKEMVNFQVCRKSFTSECLLGNANLDDSTAAISGLEKHIQDYNEF